MECFSLQTSSETNEEVNEGEETRKRRKRRSIDPNEGQEEADDAIAPYVEVYLSNPGELLNMMCRQLKRVKNNRKLISLFLNI